MKKTKNRKIELYKSMTGEALSNEFSLELINLSRVKNVIKHSNPKFTNLATKAHRVFTMWAIEDRLNYIRSEWNRRADMIPIELINNLMR
jgi:hypothetical protein